MTRNETTGKILTHGVTEEYFTETVEDLPEHVVEQAKSTELGTSGPGVAAKRQRIEHACPTDYASARDLTLFEWGEIARPVPAAAKVHASETPARYWLAVECTPTIYGPNGVAETEPRT